MLRSLTVLAPCAIGLVVAFVEPVMSQSDRLVDEQINTLETRAERNWHAFWNNHLGEWKGSWTRYTPSGEVKESFASTRQFNANPARTEIVQVNRTDDPNGRSIEKTWDYNISDHSQRDGFTHPASNSMRGLALDNGAAIWLIPSIQPNQVTPFELYLVDGDRRHSVGVIYGKKGELLRTASIREQRGGQSGFGWTNAVDQVARWSPIGLWKGEERHIFPDLSLAPPQQTSWQWMEKNLSNHFFPDGIILRCPDQIKPGQDFSFQVVWKLSNSKLQTLTVNYNNEAQLTSISHKTLTPED